MSSTPFGPLPTGALTVPVLNAISQALAQAGIFTTGKIFYLDPKNGNDLWTGTAATNQGAGVGPVKTLSAGYALLSSGNNDVLVLIGDGTTSATARLSATFTWSKNAAHFIGICSPSVVSQRARIAPTSGATAFANFFVVSGNGCYFANLQWFQGFGTGTAAEIAMTVSGTRNTFRNCHFAGMGDAASAADAGSRNLLVSAGENFFQHCAIGIDTVSRTNGNASLEISGNAARNVFEDCLFAMDAGSNAEFHFLAAAAAAIDRYTLFKNCAFINAIQSGATGLTGGFKLAASAGGMVVLQNCYSVGATNWGADATSKGQIYLSTPITTNAGGLATVNT